MNILFDSDLTLEECKGKITEIMKYSALYEAHINDTHFTLVQKRASRQYLSARFRGALIQKDKKTAITGVLWPGISTTLEFAIIFYALIVMFLIFYSYLMIALVLAVFTIPFLIWYGMVEERRTKKRFTALLINLFDAA